MKPINEQAPPESTEVVCRKCKTDWVTGADMARIFTCLLCGTGVAYKGPGDDDD